MIRLTGGEYAWRNARIAGLRAPDRSKFKKLIRQRFQGQKERHRLIANALILWQKRMLLR